MTAPQDEHTTENDAPPAHTDSRCDCANTQGNHEVACLFWPLSLNRGTRVIPSDKGGAK